jgi:23S rRNA pseudouridine1911/1915/1917 synthase
MILIYEDNHIIIVSKQSGEIVQGDKTGDTPLSETVKDYIKVKYQKPGNVFLGVVHRLDRPVSGLVMFARTSKALARLNEMFRVGDVHKTYWAIVPRISPSRPLPPPSPVGREPEGNNHPNLNTSANPNSRIGSLPTEEGGGRGRDGARLLTHWLVRNEKQNKSYAYDHEVKDSKKAQLSYRILAHSDRYSLVEVQLYTGRHHQIRCQLAKIGLPIKGDLKYGSPRSNKDGSICLLSRYMEFVHPVSKETIRVTAPLPDDSLWQAFGKIIANND